MEAHLSHDIRCVLLTNCMPGPITHYPIMPAQTDGNSVVLGPYRKPR